MKSLASVLPTGLAAWAALSSLLLAARLADAKLAAAKVPPAGWRSWNCYQLEIDEDKIVAQAEALKTVPTGYPHSLLELGYTSIGIDDGWQACGDGYKGSFHSEDRQPLVNKTRFPDLKAMVSRIHSMGVQVGFYDNNCFCKLPELYAWAFPGYPNGGNIDQDVQLLVDAEFDGVKIDGCGPAHNITKWGEAIAGVAREILVEDCGDQNLLWSPPDPDSLEASCPFNMYRISQDIAPQFYSTMYNLGKFIPFSKVSRPGCWAYPDMLQVGNRVSGLLYSGGLSFVESRTHFAAWCVTSAPLILGFDLTNSTIMREVLPIISNAAALSVNRAWAGSPGRHVANSSSTFIAYARHGASGALGTLQTFPDWWVWAKDLGHNKQAALIINVSEKPVSVSVPLSEFGLTAASASVHDIWTGKSSNVTGSLSVDNLGSHDSLFVILE